MLIAVTQSGKALDIALTARHIPPEAKQTAIRSLERLLGLTEDLSEFYEFSFRDTRLHALATRFRRVVGPCVALAEFGTEVCNSLFGFSATLSKVISSPF